MKKIIYILCLLTMSVGSVNTSLFAVTDPVRVAERDIFDEEVVFPDLKGEWAGAKVTLQADSKSGDKYSGHLEMRGEKMSFSGTVKNGILEGEISLSDGKKRAFTLEPEGKNLLFETGSFKDELKTILKENLTITLGGGVTMEMIWIKPGTFTMGSPEDELGWEDDETQHEVTLTQGYWLGKYEVTQAQYEAVMGKNPPRFKGADLPMEMVSWKDAMAFCAKLTEIEKAASRLPVGYEYTLPTEAQWEYACRAGTTTALNSGKNLSDERKCPEMDEVGWYCGNSRGETHPVGQKQPNAWGLYDMHGNVEEWCLDWYGDYPTSSVTDPTGPKTGSARVIRDGGWSCNAYYCRSADRGSYYPSGYDGSRGFRVALSLVQ